MEILQVLVVGAGLAGATIARKLAEDGFHVDVIDIRDHVAGNAHDYINTHGIKVHQYGSHIFHTDNDEVIKFLSRFTSWTPYKHRVTAQVGDEFVQFPPAVIDKEAIETFYRPYTEKMWNKKLEEVAPDILNRVKPNKEGYYFQNKFQAFPSNGYTTMVENMLDHKNIIVYLETSYNKNLEHQYFHVFNSMPIDVYYDECYGPLEWRGIEFETVSIPSPTIYPTAVVNFTHHGPHTRVTEWKNYPAHGSNPYYTTLTYERPIDGPRYYPASKDRTLYNKYKSIENDKVTFIGRCGNYVYIDMDQAVASSLAIVRKFHE